MDITLIDTQDVSVQIKSLYHKPGNALSMKNWYCSNIRSIVIPLGSPCHACHIKCKVITIKTKEKLKTGRVQMIANSHKPLSSLSDTQLSARMFNQFSEKKFTVISLIASSLYWIAKYRL